MTTTPIVNTLVVIGLGLIGGSLAASIKAAGACKQVVAVVRRPENADFALKKGIIDRFCLSVDEIAGELSAGDVIFIAVPALSIKNVLLDIKAHVSEAVTITDATSVKGIIVSAATEVYGSVPDQFILGHPIAGSEKNGITAANSVLYKNHRVILTPLLTTNAAHQERVEKMWRAVGAEVLIMSVTEHDKVLAATSHLPHVIAYALVDTLCKDKTNKETIFRYAAGGFRDFTRIASSDPTMWHDIVLTNREAILQSIDLFQHDLSSVRHAIETQDSDYLLKVFTRAKEARDVFSKKMIKNNVSEL